MNDNDFWALIWKLVGVCFCVFVLTIGCCVSYTNKLTADATDPIAVSCAISGSTASGACFVANKK